MHNRSPETKPSIVWHHGHVTREDRIRFLGQPGATIWLTGLPSSGKSTLAFTIEHALVRMGRASYVLDGDNVRHGLNKNLGFSAADRAENIRRIGEVAKLFADAGILVLTAFISPYRQDRDRVRELHRVAGLTFIEVFVDSPMPVCEKRDPKGLYRRARQGLIGNFTGVDDPYEPPLHPEIIIESHEMTPEQEAETVMDYLRNIRLIAWP